MNLKKNLSKRFSLKSWLKKSKHHRHVEKSVLKEKEKSEIKSYEKAAVLQTPGSLNLFCNEAMHKIW